ncbi:MAG: ATPase [Kiritimatiellae bacterium]|nr:ATPase [Kiritimatiellia bacterium]
MAEELQHLIDRIQKEGVEKADAQAAKIIAQAKEKAAAHVREAEEKGKTLVAKGEKDAQAFMERSIRSLEQAARDLLITVGQGVENILSDLVAESVDKALTIQVLEQMLVKMAESYAARGGEESRIELLVNEKDQQEIVKFFGDRYKEQLVRGVKLHVDNDIFKGFKVSFADGRVQHDFTREAIAESLVNFLRPQLAEIVHRVAREGSQTDKG